MKRICGRPAAQIALIAVFVIGMFITGGILAKIMMGYKADRSMYERLASDAIRYIPEENDVPEDDAPSKEMNVRVVSEVPIEVDWDYLQETNPDIIAWLYCSGTVINYPIMQTGNNDYYLHHGPDGQYNVAGALFADCDSAINVALSNFIVYGHNMKDGSMFHSLINYNDEEYAKENSIMYLLTPEQNYKVLLYGANVVEATAPAFTTFFREDSTKEAYIQNVLSHSFWTIPEHVEDKMLQTIVLSTCTYGGNWYNPRMLVYGLLLPVV